MSLTKPLNSKVNMKQYSNADLPVNPKQPAIARYAAESTANQTTINLPFQIDTVNAADSFLLMVDGKVLTPGSTNDYQFAGIDSFGFSSTISLNYSLVAGLNIQAIKLGLKKETEFVQDARFTALYEGIDQGLQGFVRTADLMVATTSVGTPASGQFYSSIQNRAAIPDMRFDLKARMGIERIATQQIFPIQNEAGPNGETVYGLLNDTLQQVRFVGTWTQAIGSNGSPIGSTVVNDFVEITFYGTGLNVLAGSETARDMRASVDGGAEGSNLMITQTNVIYARNYGANVVVNAVSNLALGVHTVKLRVNTSAGNFLWGFEILNESSSIRVQQGASYLAGKKASTVGEQILSYNSAFESGTLGTRGGRVIVYQKADGTIAKAVQPVDASSATLTSADHSNEEVSRTYYPREFGAGRTALDDFTTEAGTARNRFFTLDDGTTTLMGLNSFVAPALSKEAVGITNSASNYITFTFVGTGLDIEVCGLSSGTFSSVQIDGAASIGSIAGSPTAYRIAKVVSGLPYGTHTVKFLASGVAAGIARFIVYQPKKPALPAGAVELADYNVMANYDSSAVTGTAVVDHLQVPQGTLFKAVTREHVYVGGSWALGSPDPNYASGIVIGPATSNSQPVSYTFFGTGFLLTHLASSGGTYDFSITIDGALNATGVAKTNASNLGGGSYRSTSTTSGAPCRIEVTGLTLGLHTVTIQRTAGAGSWNFSGLHLITPIHSVKSNLYADIQNTLPVGSCALSDNRKTSAIKDDLPSEKPWLQAIGISSGPTSTSTASVPVPDLSLTVKTTGGALDIAAFVTLRNNTLSSSNTLSIYVDGVLASPESTIDIPVANNNNAHNITAVVPVAPGVHKVDIYHRTSGGTTTFAGVGRLLKVRET